MKKYMVTVNGKRFEVEIEEVGGTSPIPQRNEEVSVAKAEPIKPAPQAPSSTAGGKTVKAPMPGSIVDVRVSPGQKFKKGDVLFILEAMKMENEIMAGEEGTILSVEVSRGDTVNTDDVLATFA
jgi:biotin carboxyl carrier protein